MRSHIPSDVYLLPSVASMTFVLMLGLGFILFGDRSDAAMYAASVDAQPVEPTWTGEPRIPSVERKFRRLKPY